MNEPGLLLAVGASAECRGKWMRKGTRINQLLLSAASTETLISITTPTKLHSFPAEIQAECSELLCFDRDDGPRCQTLDSFLMSRAER